MRLWQSWAVLYYAVAYMYSMLLQQDWTVILSQFAISLGVLLVYILLFLLLFG